MAGCDRCQDVTSVRMGLVAGWDMRQDVAGVRMRQVS